MVVVFDMANGERDMDDVQDSVMSFDDEEEFAEPVLIDPLRYRADMQLFAASSAEARLQTVSDFLSISQDY
jgi:hypothetical protein